MSDKELPTDESDAHEAQFQRTKDRRKRFAAAISKDAREGFFGMVEFVEDDEDSYCFNLQPDGLLTIKYYDEEMESHIAINSIQAAEALQRLLVAFVERERFKGKIALEAALQP